MEGGDSIEDTLTVQWYQSNDKMKKWLHEDESDAPCIPFSFCPPVPCFALLADGRGGAVERASE